MRAALSTTAAVVVGVALAACTKPAAGTPPRSAAPGAGKANVSVARASLPAGVVAQATALLTVALHSDASAELTGLTVKPIPFRARHLLPYDAAAHESRGAAGKAATSQQKAATGQQSESVVVTPGPGPVPQPVPDAHAPRPPEPLVLVVRTVELPQPLVVQLDLGMPGEGGGDVMDRWRDGTVLLRAPYFGAGTLYSLVRSSAQGPVELSRWEAQP